MPENQSASTENSRKGRLAKTVKQLKEEGVQFLLNSLNQPTIFIPDDPFQQHWPADHERFLVHVSSVYNDLTDDYLKSGERDMLVDLFKAECYRGGRRMTTVEAEAIDKDPIVQAFIAFHNNEPEYSGLTATFLEKLSAPKIQNQLVPRTDSFPTLTMIFSRRVNRLRPVLTGLGIAVEITHAENGSHIRSRRLDSFTPEPDASRSNASAQSSDATPANGRDFDPDDESDGVLRYDTTAMNETNPALTQLIRSPETTIVPNTQTVEAPHA
jgi:hypothetical protein